MNKNKRARQIHRIKSIYMFLKLNGMAKTTNLALEFECDRKTILHDLRILEDNRRVKSVKPGIWKAI